MDVYKSGKLTKRQKQFSGERIVFQQMVFEQLTSSAEKGRALT